MKERDSKMKIKNFNRINVNWIEFLDVYKLIKKKMKNWGINYKN